MEQVLMSSDTPKQLELALEDLHNLLQQLPQQVSKLDRYKTFVEDELSDENRYIGHLRRLNLDGKDDFDLLVNNSTCLPTSCWLQTVQRNLQQSHERSKRLTRFLN